MRLLFAVLALFAVLVALLFGFYVGVASRPVELNGCQYGWPVVEPGRRMTTACFVLGDQWGCWAPARQGYRNGQSMPPEDL